MARQLELHRLLASRRSELFSSDNEWEQFMVYLEAFMIFQDREEQYHSLWQKTGAIDSLFHVQSKAARCSTYFSGDTGEDTPLDLINFAVFLIRNMRAGRIRNMTDSLSELKAVAVAFDDIKAGETVIVDLETNQIRKA